MRTVGRYELLHEIGRGGMATVYLARQIELERLVALKELGAFHADDPAKVRGFVNESRLAGSLTHANIITVYEYFEDAGLPYISMECARRGSLRPLVGRLTLPQAAGVLVSVLNGLACAEEHGVVHRDLKPENLMLGDDGNMKIADFGIAKAINRLTTLGVRTATGTTVGTPDYMAPEQATGQSVTSATDRYSLGVMAYELVTGRKPFDGDDLLSILYKHVNDPLPPPRSVNPELDAELADWIARLLEKEPENRIPSAQQALEELEDIAIRLHGARWRRLAALPAVDVTESAPRGRSKVFVTFDIDQAAAGAVDEPSEPVGAWLDAGVPATKGPGKTAGSPVEQAKPLGDVAEGTPVAEPEAPEAEGATIAPRAPLPVTTLAEHAQDATGRGRSVRESGVPGRWRRWWLWAALFLVAAGVAVATASVLGGGADHAAQPPGSSTAGVSRPPSPLHLGAYSVVVPSGWKCDGACREVDNGPAKGFRLALVGPKNEGASIDRYPLERNMTLSEVRAAVLAQLHGIARGQIVQANPRGAWDYSFGTGVRRFAGTVRLFARTAYHVQVTGYPPIDVGTILNTLVASLRPAPVH